MVVNKRFFKSVRLHDASEWKFLFICDLCDGLRYLYRDTSDK